MKTVWLHIRWLHQKPAYLDLHCFQKEGNNYEKVMHIERSAGVCVVGGGGGTLIFSYIRRFGPFFWVQNFEFQYFFFFFFFFFFGGGGGVRKMNIFGGIIIWRFCGYFWGVLTNIELVLVVICLHLRGLFLRSMGRKIYSSK